jgi:predicted metal-dependent phosphotriesterase family hydrolase
MKLKKIKRIRKALTLSIILATGLKKYFKYREYKKEQKNQKEDK